MNIPRIRLIPCGNLRKGGKRKGGENWARLVSGFGSNKKKKGLATIIVPMCERTKEENLNKGRGTSRLLNKLV